MIFKTRGIVLHRMRYSESSIIARIYTEQFGLCSFLLQGARKKNAAAKASLLQPLSLVELVMYHKETSGLQKVKELKIEHPLSLQDNIAKTSIALFLSEMLMHSIKEETPNRPLYVFLSESIKALDTLESPANFHLLFLIKLSRFLGFYPHEASGNKPYFDLSEGVFTSERPESLHYLSPRIAAMLRQMLTLDFNQLQNIHVDGAGRKALLESLIDYYRLHLTGFREIKSYSVLETVLGE